MNGSALLALPTELLIQILEEVGGRELRRSYTSLLVCRRWYQLAKPVYHSGKHLTQVHVFGNNLAELDDGRGMGRPKGSRFLMHKNTRHLRLRFLGHWWDEKTSQQILMLDDALRDEPISNVADTQQQLDGTSAFPDEDDVDDGHPPGLEGMIFNRPQVLFDAASGKAKLQQWRVDDLEPRLASLFTDLPHFTSLEKLTFEATCDPIPSSGPRWSYLSLSTITQFLQNIPLTHNLQILTLDLTLGTLLPPNPPTTSSFPSPSPPTHLCPHIARIMPRIPHVRLRTFRICDGIFKGLGPAHSTSTRIQTLILKLNTPYFEQDIPAAVRNALPCPEMESLPDAARMVGRMYKGAVTFLQRLAAQRSSNTPTLPASAVGDAGHGMAGLRITYPTPGYPNLMTLDCLTGRNTFFGEDVFAFEEDGLPRWFEFAPEAERMLDGGPYTFRSR